MQGGLLANAARNGAESSSEVLEGRNSIAGSEDLQDIHSVLQRLSVVPSNADADKSTTRTQLLEELVQCAQSLLEQEKDEDKDKTVAVDVGGSEDNKEADEFKRNSSTSRMIKSLCAIPMFPAREHGGLRKRMFLVFEDHTTSKLSKVTLFVLVLTILVSTVTFLMESEPRFKFRKPECVSCKARHAMFEAARQAGREVNPADDCMATVNDCKPVPQEFFYLIEAICIGIFTVDYVVRVLLSHAGFDGNGHPTNPFARTFAYWRQPMNIVDLLAILPFYVELGMTNSGGLGVIAVLRLARILRIFKLTKHHPGVKMFAEVLIMSGQPLFVLVFLNFIIVLVFGTLIYNVEGQQFSVDEKFVSNVLYENGTYVRAIGFHNMETELDVSPFHSIPRSIWWVCVTLTTVGYGDYSPTTFWGKTVGVIAFYVGILFLALPISVLGSNFEIVYNREFSQVEEEQEKKRLEQEKNKKKQEHMRTSKLLQDTEVGLLPRSPDGSPMDIRKKIFLMFDNPAASKVGKVIALLMLVVILVVTTSFILESMPRFNETPDRCQVEKTVENCEPTPPGAFHTIEVVGIGIFTFDYVMRLLTVHGCKPFECGIAVDDMEVANKMPGWKVTLKYVMQPMNIIDLLAILPFYLQAIGLGGTGATSVLRVLRLIRVFRVLRMPQLSSCVNMFVQIVADSLPALFLLFFMTLLTCVLTASCIVFAEGSNYSVSHGPGSEYALKYGSEICGWEGCYIRPTTDGYDTMQSPFISIPYAFWWFFATATTVGYGDDFPTTTLGRVIGVIAFYVGIILLALPITIVGGCLSKHYGKWAADLEEARSKGKAKGDGTSSEASASALRSVTRGGGAGGSTDNLYGHECTKQAGDELDAINGKSNLAAATGSDDDSKGADLQQVHEGPPNPTQELPGAVSEAA